MENLITMLNANEGHTVVAGFSEGFIKITSEYISHVKFDGNDLIIGEDDDHCIRLIEYKKWWVVVDNGFDFILHSPDDEEEIMLCVC